MTFDPNAWAERWNAGGDRGELAAELVEQLRQVEYLPADVFDRPQLAAALAAAHGTGADAARAAVATPSCTIGGHVYADDVPAAAEPPP